LMTGPSNQAIKQRVFITGASGDRREERVRIPYDER
jgi:hypothetical protein